jgi:hypothetical protein
MEPKFNTKTPRLLQLAVLLALIACYLIVITRGFLGL